MFELGSSDFQSNQNICFYKAIENFIPTLITTVRISYQYLVLYQDRVRSSLTIRRIVFYLNNHVRSKNELVIDPKFMIKKRNEIEE